MAGRNSKIGRVDKDGRLFYKYSMLHPRGFWILAFCLLVFAQGLDAYGHIRIAANDPCCLDHADHSGLPSEGDDSQAPCSHMADHSHAPAIVECHRMVCCLTQSFRLAESVPLLPDSPVRAIDYPPQLS